MQSKQIIVVLGMHRSGTSALTRGLKIIGADLGDRLMSPVEGDNPTGFWEDLDFYEMDVELMNALVGEWDSLAQIDQDALRAALGGDQFSQAVALVNRKLANVGLFGLKDPRLARLMSFWKEVFSHCNVDVEVVLALRNPRSVADSLFKRNGIDRGKSYCLWICHVLEILRNCAGLKYVVVDYDNLVESPENEFRRIAREFGHSVNAEELQAYKASFVEGELRHTKYQLNELSEDSACPQLARDIYTTLFEVACDEMPSDVRRFNAPLQEWMNEFKRLQPMFDLVDRLCAANQTLSNPMITELKTANSWLETQRAAFESLATAREESVLELTGWAEKLKEANAWLESQRAAFESLAAAREYRVKELEVRIDALEEANRKSDQLLSNRIRRLFVNLRKKLLH